MKIKNALILKLLFVFCLAIPSFSFAFIIGGFVYNDKNCNGVRNAGDSGIPGVTVTLTPGGITTTTNSLGHYMFTGVLPGTYTITETDPEGYCSISPNIRTVKVKGKDILLQNFGNSKQFVSPPSTSCCPEHEVF